MHTAIGLQSTSLQVLKISSMIAEREHRYVDQLAALSTAHRLAPGHARHLFGRAIAHERNGQPGAAQADLQLARAISPEVENEYARYGIRASSTTPN